MNRGYLDATSAMGEASAAALFRIVSQFRAERVGQMSKVAPDLSEKGEDSEPPGGGGCAEDNGRQAATEEVKEEL
ncbi:hypothetical protein MRX96_033039 [Rhipicephalus microplus]